MSTVLSRSMVLAATALLSVILGSGSPSTTFADSAYVAPSQPVTYSIAGSYYNSGVTLTEDVPANPAYVNLKISDQSLLRTGWQVKINDEVMRINNLIDGGAGYPPPPDTMVVYRGWAGTPVSAHVSGASINGPSVTVDIWAKGVTAAGGLGSFEVDLTFPSGAEYLKVSPLTEWLTSTGRTDVWCDGPAKVGDTWKLWCWTVGATPDGPTGSGKIARVIVWPSPPPGQAVIVSLSGSKLTDPFGHNISGDPQNMAFKTIACPDTNVDNYVNILDVLDTVRGWGGRGKDCGVTLVSNVTASQTPLQINDQGLAWWSGIPQNPACALPGTNRPDTIAIDGEIMTVGQFTDGSPDTVSVTRPAPGSATSAKAHSAGSPVYLTSSQWDPMHGKNGYTPARDVDDNLFINILDTLVVAQAWSGDQKQCPQ